MFLENKMVKFGEIGSVADWKNSQGREVSELAAMLFLNLGVIN